MPQHTFQHTVIEPDGEVDNRTKETYGKGEVLFRIGNGGAGATGLLEVLANDYLSTTNQDKSIEWVCNHSRNTQLALNYGCVEIALTYERDQEAVAAREGWSVTAGCMFHDHFVLAGPTSDPAGLSSATSLPDALGRIHRQGSPFHSRVDGSATMWKERSLWSACGLQPWDTEAAKTWYKKSLDTPADALKAADEAGVYILTDRATLLRQTLLQTISRTTVFFEPSGAEDTLMNNCYALYSSSAPSEKSWPVKDFIEYLLSARGQGIIAGYGTGEVGLPLFAPLSDGYAKTLLKGGVSRGGRWVALSAL